MIAIGIDPGSLRIGLAWVRSGKVNSRYTMSWKSMERLPARYIDMREHLEKQLFQVPEYPSIVAIELPIKPYGKRDTIKKRDLQILYGCFAVVAAEVGRMFKDTILLPVQYDVWTGGLQKKEVQEQLLRKYDLRGFENDDCADALGIADYAFEIARRNGHGQAESKNEGCPHSLRVEQTVPESIHEAGS